MNNIIFFVNMKTYHTVGYLFFLWLRVCFIGIFGDKVNKTVFRSTHEQLTGRYTHTHSI